jgi:hypothetical protein
MAERRLRVLDVITPSQLACTKEVIPNGQYCLLLFCRKLSPNASENLSENIPSLKVRVTWAVFGDHFQHQPPHSPSVEYLLWILHSLLPHRLQYRTELFQCRLHVIDDFLGDYIGIGQVVGVFEAFVFEVIQRLFGNPNMFSYISELYGCLHVRFDVPIQPND